MSELYLEYLNEIEKRKLSGLSPKPIDSEELTNIIISQILDLKSDYRNQSLMFLPIIYCLEPQKQLMLKQIF